MKIIKSLAMYVLFANVAYSADLPELPEDHPIKRAFHITKHMFYQDPGNTEYANKLWQCIRVGGSVGTSVRGIMHYGIREYLSDTHLIVLKSWEECIDKLFLIDDIRNVFLINSLMQSSLLREYNFYYSHGGLGLNINIGETIDTITSELDKYIHQSFEEHFTLRMEDKKFASAYKLALVYRNANTAHVENTAKANTWITEIHAKATAEVEYAAELCVALSFSPLREKQHENARRIIESFPQESEPRLHLQSAFDAVLTRPARPIPTGDRLIIYREIADKLFRKKDEV